MADKVIGIVGRDDFWPWPRIQRTFQSLLKKLIDAQQKKATKDQLLSILDWWIGQLYLVRSAIEAGQFPAILEKPMEVKPAAKPRLRTR